MATINAPEKPKNPASLGKMVDYCNKNGIFSGVNCPDDPAQAKEQMQATKELWGKEGGRQYKHYVQNFKPGETFPAKAHEIGVKLAQERWPGYEVAVGTHIDKGHIHNHFVVSSVSFETGKKIDPPKHELQEIKDRSDEICKDYGLSVVDRTKQPERGEIRAYSGKKYEAIVNGRSRIANLAQAVDRSLEKGGPFSDFKASMEQEGYNTELRGEKHITFSDKDGNKIRGANLAKTFSDDRYTREGIMCELIQDRTLLSRDGEENQNQNEVKRHTPIGPVPTATTGIDYTPTSKPYCDDSIEAITNGRVKSSSQNRGAESARSRGVDRSTPSTANLRNRVAALKSTLSGNGKENKHSNDIQPRVTKRNQDNEYER